MSSPAVRNWTHIEMFGYKISFLFLPLAATKVQSHSLSCGFHQRWNTVKNVLLEILQFLLKFTFIGFTNGTCLRSLAPLSPSNLPDNIPSHLLKVNLVFETKNNQTELRSSANESYPYLPKNGGLCIAVWSPLCMILHCP